MSILPVNRTNLFGAILFFGLLAFTARPATDPDLWWHLRTGEWIVQNHQIPHTDPFSFTRNGSPWISHEWLSELLFYEIWRFTSWAGLIIFSAILTTTGFMFLFWRCKAPAHWAAAATALGALAAAPAWGARPQMFTFLMASSWLWLLERGEANPRLLFFIPPLFLLWINLHAGFALGPALLAAFAFGLISEGITGTTEWTAVRTELWRLVVLFAACMALVPLNPSGAELYRYPLDVLRSGMMRSFISEWHSPNFHSASYVPLLLIDLALLVVLALRPSRPRGRILVPLIGTFLAAHDALRHIAIFILLAAPVIVAGMPGGRRAWSVDKAKTSGRFKFVAAALVIALLAVFTLAQWFKLTRDQAENEADRYPTLAVAQLKSSNSPQRVFAFYDWGGYVIWKLFPGSRVFIDGRADLYGDEFLRQFQDAMQLRPGWRKTLNQWDVDAVLVPASSALAQGLLLDQDWRRKYHDSDTVLYLRGAQISQIPENLASNQPSPGLDSPQIPLVGAKK
jgi:hypothetical protein